jgi:CRISPR-associated endonuclease Csn1
MDRTDTIWAFDLGKGSIGEAVRRGTQFLHKASLLIPAGFAETKPAANRRRMMRTRQAHKAREQWLDQVWGNAGLEPLRTREVELVDFEVRRKRKKVRDKIRWKNKKVGGRWILARKADYRLEREFAPKIGEKTKDAAPSDEAGANVCYTSCLLRIKLLRGEKLEPWQIYKALHSAIQKRGYERVPWAAREAKRKLRSEDADKEMASTQKRMEEFERMLVALSKGKPEFHYSCYFDAHEMGLWDGGTQFKDRIDCRAKSTRNQIVPRHLVEKEIRDLMDAAAKHYPKLKGQAEYLLYGPAKKPYASYNTNPKKAPFLKEGAPTDWQGVLGQKIPRFDNRILNDCALIPRLHVCRNPDRDEYKKLPDDKLLPAQVTFLMKLKNMRVEEKTPERKQRGLTAAQIKDIFEEYNPKRKYNLTSTQWRNWCEQFDVLPITDAGEKGTGATEEANKKEKKEEKNAVEAPTAGGRCRFSRPALRILKALILSGLKPSLMHKKLFERDSTLLTQLGVDVLDSPPIKEKKDTGGNVFRNYVRQSRPWLLGSDLSFLLAMRKTGAKEDSWEDLFIPNQRLDQVVQEISSAGRGGDAKAERQRRNVAIQELIGSQNDPIVRHRLNAFWDRLKHLEDLRDENEQPFGEPDQIVLEFVREDFMGQKAKTKLKQFQDERAAARKKAREYGGLKYELYEAQGGLCLYGKQVIQNGKCVYLENGLPQPNTPGWDALVIDHIVPREAPYNGPDAMVNYVLTTPNANSAKRKRTPFDWFHQDRLDQWDCYKNFATSKIGTLGGKKVQLLTRADAAELVSKYTSLAETAWISKLAQTLIRLHFGWPLEHQRGKERVTVVPGGLTGRIRRKYLLNTLLDTRFKSLPTAQIKSEDEE